MSDDRQILLDKLANDSTYQALEKVLLIERDKLVTSILAGQHTPEDYVAACGEIRGLDRVLRRPRNPLPLGQR